MNRKALLIVVLLSFCFYGLGFGQQTLPYSYGFEDNNLATDGWTTQNPANSNSSEFGIYSSANRSGSYGFRFSSYSSASSYDQYLISPQLSVAGDAINITAQFYYKATNSSSETFKVGYSTTDTELTSFTWGNEVSTNNTN